MSTEKTAKWNKHLKTLVVPGPRTTPESISRDIERVRGRLGISLYKLASGQPFTRDSVVRLLHGEGTHAMGGVRLSTFLKILKAAGLDIEIVTRSGTGRSLANQE